MILVEVLPNPNCDPVDQRVFVNSCEPSPVKRVRLSPPGTANAPPNWYEITGWTADGKPVAAQAAKVEDSGSGTVTLVFGGDGGLRLRPAGSKSAWSPQAKDQYGVPFLLLEEESDVEPPQPGSA